MEAAQTKAEAAEAEAGLAEEPSVFEGFRVQGLRLCFRVRGLVDEGLGFEVISES